MARNDPVSGRDPVYQNIKRYSTPSGFLDLQFWGVVLYQKNHHSCQRLNAEFFRPFRLRLVRCQNRRAGASWRQCVGFGTPSHGGSCPHGTLPMVACTRSKRSWILMVQAWLQNFKVKPHRFNDEMRSWVRFATMEIQETENLPLFWPKLP